MQITRMNHVPMYVSSRDTPLLVNDSKALSFSTLMQGRIDDKTSLTQETANQKQSASSCDCDKSMKLCTCDSGKETEEVTETKKSGIAACVDCSNRKSGQCAMWNGKNDDSIFNLLSVNFSVNATQADVTKILDIQTHLDVIAKASSDDDYTNAYAYARRKFIHTDLE